MLCQKLGRGRLGLIFVVEAVDAHAEPAELDVDVGSFGEALDRRRPDREHLGTPAGIGADAERAAARSCRFGGKSRLTFSV